MFKILQARLQQHINWELTDVQAGFRKGRRTRDQIINIHWIMKKAREFQKDIYFCFIDYAKASDCVDYNKLWKNFKEMEITDHFTCLLRNLFAGQEAIVRTANETKDWFKIRKGVWQGCIWSSCLLKYGVSWLFSCPSCLTLCDPMDCSMQGVPSPHHPELAKVHVHCISNAIQPSHSLMPPPPPAINRFQHQGLFQWVALRIRWPKYWSFSFSISTSNEYSRLISFKIDWFDFLAVQGILRSLLKHYSSKASILWHSVFFMVQFSLLYMTTWKTIALTMWSFVSKVISLLFNTLSRFVIAFQPRSKPLLISCLQSPSTVILETKKRKSITVFTFFPFYLTWNNEARCHDLSSFNI